ncbi:MAG: DNA translocase FtsK 4TM domain-containing protein [Pseudomonas sp.]|nr:DNA translocase FtsK 4TM domain-containing protein [Pseudomonas sp.]
MADYGSSRRRRRRKYSVLKNSSSTAPAVVWRQQLGYRLKEGALIAAVFACLFLLMTLLSYSPGDPAWDHSIQVRDIKNAGGIIGARISSLLLGGLGYFAYLFPLLLGIRAWQIFRNRHLPWGWNGWLFVWHLSGLVLLIAAGTALAHIHFIPQPGMQQSGGGIFGASLGHLAENTLNVQGSTLAFLALFFFGLTVFTDLSWFKVMDLTGKITLDLIELIQSFFSRWWNARAERKQLVAQLREVDDVVSEVAAPMVRDRREQAKVKERIIERDEALARHMSERDKRVAPVIAPPPPSKPSEPSKRVLKEKQATLFVDPLVEGSLPPISLLDAAEKQQKQYSPESLEAMSRLLEIKLKEFGVEVVVESVHPGPVITRFEIQPAAGVKVSRISNLAKDLARSLAVISVRVVEVIPGKTTVGIEIPNEDRQIVRFSEVLSSAPYDDAKSPVTLALGHDIGGKPVIADLAKMPHLLVAGTTGSGKSVGVNAMILSILFKSTPEEARLIMIDPKMLELSIYEGIPHLLCPVVTDMKEAANALRWSVAEMERRYKLMAAMGVRNLAGFNRKIKEAEEAGTPLTDPLFRRESMDDQPPLLKALPTIVVVVDEFADMMMIVGKKVEELIARIAQKARAAGIHLILATQRPSVDVITGLIKANVPTRIAFQVSSKIDSRTILDQMGAETLLGMGDMLYLAPGTGLPVRVHGAFVADDEVHKVVDHLKRVGPPDYVEGILAAPEDDLEAALGGGGEGGDGEADPLYDQAVEVVIKTRRPSISLVQRHLRIGYNRAARLIEQMERAGLVSAMGSNGNREVIVPAKEGE